MMADIAVLGAGSYGTALAILLARNGHKTLLWGHEPEHVAALASARMNQQFLPDIPFPETLEPCAELAEVGRRCRDILVVVPSFAFGDVLTRSKPYLRADVRLAWATKGLEHCTGRLLSEPAQEILGEQTPLAVLSGPTFAKEIALGMPTAIAVAATDDDFANYLASLLHCSNSFRVYRNNDFIGLQLGGAVKNVIAIAAGMSDGMGFGANARTALITRGLAEMNRLGQALGAATDTFMGMSGLGDLVLTCTDNQSRNRRFGMAIGQGKALADAEAEIGQVVEGLRNTREVKMLADRLQVEMPITQALYDVLHNSKSPKAAAYDLLSRTPKSEC